MEKENCNMNGMEDVIDFDEMLENYNTDKRESTNINFEVFETLGNPIKKISEMINLVAEKVVKGITEFIEKLIEPLAAKLIEVRNDMEKAANKYTSKQRYFLKKAFEIVDRKTGIIKVLGYEKICSLVGEDKIIKTIEYSTCASIAKYFNISEKAVRAMIKRINGRGRVFDIRKNDKNVKCYSINYNMRFLMLLNRLEIL